MGAGFWKRSCSKMERERDDDSKKNHRALAGAYPSWPRGRASRCRARGVTSRAGLASAFGGLAALPIHLRRVEHLVGVAEVEDQAAEVALLERDRAVEAADAPGVAGAGADLLDAQPQRVLVAVDPHLDDALGVARA